MHIILVQQVHKYQRVKYQAQYSIKTAARYIPERTYRYDTPEGYVAEIYNTVYYAPYRAEQEN